MNLKYENIIREFQIEGKFLGAEPYGSGHINGTLLGSFEYDGRIRRFIHQRINCSVFKQPEKVMENIGFVTRHLQHKILEAGGDPLREALNLVPTRNGADYFVSSNGEYWRTYLFIEGARTYDQAENPRQVYSANKAFGKFQMMVSKLPSTCLHETIPDFHNTKKRFLDFIDVLNKDPLNRAFDVKEEIDFYLKREPDTSVIINLIEKGEIPERITHNDTKLNNVLIDDITGEGICVLDLDTMMPGSALYDFGDSVRIGACTAAEDETDLSKVKFDMTMFEQLTKGYLDTAKHFLTAKELEFLPFSAILMTLECGMRFLTDYLNGDVYFKISRPEHNLDRTRTQIKMVREMEQSLDEMSSIVAAACKQD